MFDFSSLPLTPDNARAARNYLGFSQAKAADESGLPSHKLKRFETGTYLPDEAFLSNLRAFYERSGYTFDDTEKPGSKARKDGLVFPAGVVAGAAHEASAAKGSRPAQATIHHMRIAITDDDEMGRLLDMIEANEEKVQELLREPVESGLFFGISDETKKRHAQVVRIMADNGVMFAKLFGREIGGTPLPDVIAGKKQPTTGAELLHSMQADMHLTRAGDPDAKDRQKGLKPAASVLNAIGLN